MKFSKYNNPRKKRPKKKSPYSREYINAKREEMYVALGRATSDKEKEIIIQAFNISINP